MITTKAPTTIRSIARTVSAVLVATVVALSATACEPPGCAKDCVETVTVNQAATGTRLTFTDKAKVTLTIYSDSGRKVQAAKQSATTMSKIHTLSHTRLNPNQNYWYTAVATDEAGASWTEHGSFRTFKRNLTLKVTRIHLIDDSDSVGSGEIRFGMRAGGIDFGEIYKNGSMSSGTDLKNLTISKSIPNVAPASFRIDIMGMDDDCEGIGSLCTGGTMFDYHTGGSNSDLDWASASTGTITSPNLDDSGNWSVTTNKYALKFTVSGTWTVTYTA